MNNSATLGLVNILAGLPLAALLFERHARATSKGDQVKSEQWDWIKRYGPDCGLPLRGRPADEEIHIAAACVREAMEARIKELQAEQ